MNVTFVSVIQQLSDEPVPPELSKVRWRHVCELAWSLSFCISTIQTSKQKISIYANMSANVFGEGHQCLHHTNLLTKVINSHDISYYLQLFSCFSMIVYFVSVFVWCNHFMKGSRSVPSSGCYILHLSIYFFKLQIPVWDYKISSYLSTIVRYDI